MTAGLNKLRKTPLALEFTTIATTPSLGAPSHELVVGWDLFFRSL